jgi:hypothetical protein
MANIAETLRKDLGTDSSQKPKKGLFGRFIDWFFFDELGEHCERQMEQLVKDMKISEGLADKMVRKTLVLSTAHYDLDTDNNLGVHAFVHGDLPTGKLPLNISAVEYGFIIQVFEDPDDTLSKEELEEIGLGKIYDIIVFAMKTGCNYVHFDSDGPVYDNFPTYEW